MAFAWHRAVKNRIGSHPASVGNADHPPAPTAQMPSSPPISLAPRGETDETDASAKGTPKEGSLGLPFQEGGAGSPLGVACEMREKHCPQEHGESQLMLLRRQGKQTQSPSEAL